MGKNKAYAWSYSDLKAGNTWRVVGDDGTKINEENNSLQNTKNESEAKENTD